MQYNVLSVYVNKDVLQSGSHEQQRVRAGTCMHSLEQFRLDSWPVPP
jgi:hypothetical protein